MLTPFSFPLAHCTGWGIIRTIQSPSDSRRKTAQSVWPYRQNIYIDMCDPLNSCNGRLVVANNEMSANLKMTKDSQPEFPFYSIVCFSYSGYITLCPRDIILVYFLFFSHIPGRQITELFLISDMQSKSQFMNFYVFIFGEFFWHCRQCNVRCNF